MLTDCPVLMMWALVVVFYIVSSRYVTDASMDTYTCRGGKFLAIHDITLNNTGTSLFCTALQGSRLKTGGVDVSQYLCGATLTPGQFYWVDQCTVAESISGQITLTTNCSSKAFPICSSSFPFPAVAPTIRPVAAKIPPKGQIWKIIGQSEYFVIDIENTFVAAFEYCNRTYGASLLYFFDVTSYFEILSQLGLSKNTYWLGANVNQVTQTAHCVTYHSDNNSITPQPCSDMAFSVCRRSIYNNNTDRALQHPLFIQLIEEMTVKKSETVVNQRKLISVDDKRPSAQTAGGLGVFILCGLLSVMFILDLTRLKK